MAMGIAGSQLRTYERVGSDVHPSSFEAIFCLPLQPQMVTAQPPYVSKPKLASVREVLNSLERERTVKFEGLILVAGSGFEPLTKGL